MLLKIQSDPGYSELLVIYKVEESVTRAYFTVVTCVYFSGVRIKKIML